MGDVLQSVQALSVPAFIVSCTAAMGLTLTPRAMVAPLKSARVVMLALGLNFVLAPAFAWLLTFVIPLDRGHSIGLMLLGGAAGAPFLPKLVENARGDAALAAALMCLLTLGTILFLPFALPLMIPSMRADAWSIAAPMLLLIVVPMIAGMLINVHAGSFAIRVAPLLAKISNASFLLFAILLVTRNMRTLLGVIGSGAVLAALLYIAGLLAAGWLVGGAKVETRGTVALATAARNFAAALVPAAKCFADPKPTVMLTVSAIVCLALTFLAAGWLRRKASMSRTAPQ